MDKRSQKVTDEKAEPGTVQPDEPGIVKGPEVIAAHVKNLPHKPGVYRMTDRRGTVLYVGKAKNLKKRVSAYTRLTGHTNRIARMISATTDMEFVITRTETEALLLEASLIKRLKPTHNVILRDDKSFPYILIGRDHDVPQILKHRGARKRQGDYFGPFASAGAVNQTLNTLQKAFLLRTCTDSVYESRTRPCLLYQIKRCSAPCTGETTPEAYNALVDEAVDFLSGRSTRIQSDLSENMEQASENLNFEKAAVFRDRIRALTQIQARQGINPRTVEDADVIAAHADGGQTCVQVFFIRSGQNWGTRAYFPRHERGLDAAEVLDSFAPQFYTDRPPPRLVLLSHKIESAALLSEALKERSGYAVNVTIPQRGEKRELMDHALTNAREALSRRLAESASQRQLLEETAQVFELDDVPQRIEVYDNSHVQGSNPVGAMIVAGPDGLEKNQYRKFNIQDTEASPGDDYAMMREVLTRRFTRLIKERAAQDDIRSTAWPDVILIDGGPGQMSIAEQVLDELGVSDVTIISIAKGPDRNAGREHFYVSGRQPFMLEPRSPVLYFMQRLRDEAHRFAIGTHRARRAKAIGGSPLDEISGIGAKRKRALLNHFGSARAVSQAGVEDLSAVQGISDNVAQRVYDHFHGES